jgi:hypothetical protein
LTFFGINIIRTFRRQPWLNQVTPFLKADGL